MSSTLGVGTYENRTAFRPGEIVAGKAMWILDADPKSVEIRLFWYTEGRGDQDVAIVATQVIQTPGRRSEAEFRFTLPEAPYSFKGSLITLLWAIEVVVLPSKESARQAIFVSPKGCELLLPVIPA
ncbi:MAG: hypothetical protein C0404_07700 [Verrucomicrobia bacterium]|nr:hypothetical protein [Verrucomicrobiota bacterium]